MYCASRHLPAVVVGCAYSARRSVVSELIEKSGFVGVSVCISAAAWSEVGVLVIFSRTTTRWCEANCATTGLSVRRLPCSAPIVRCSYSRGQRLQIEIFTSSILQQAVEVCHEPSKPKEQSRESRSAERSLQGYSPASRFKHAA